MQQPELVKYRVRIGWLDSSNEVHWTDWYEVTALKETYLNGVPISIANQGKDGIIIGKDGRQYRQMFAKQGRYIPSHRIIAVDWEAV